MEESEMTSTEDVTFYLRLEEAHVTTDYLWK